ncbi:MAG: CvpA family protein [Rickettsiales bacterium]|jgi:membrane protein required for colicin V production|nr:CvpA family protein [Rickettsiales bacterium]
MLTVLDFVFLAVVFVSAVFGYSGGFVAGVFSLISWIITALVAKKFYPSVEPVFEGSLGQGSMLSSIAAYASIFVSCIMLLSFLAKWSGAKLHETNFDGIDKSLGFLFGIMRGILVMSVVEIGILWFFPLPEERPKWALDAKSRPVLRSSALFVSFLLPDEGNFKAINSVIRGNIKDDEFRLKALNRPEAGALDSATSADTDGYKASEMKDLERQLKQLDQLESDFLK